MNRRALTFYGGWDGHHPAEMAERTRGALEQEGFEVAVRDSLDCLAEGEDLLRYDLIVPNWTMGTLDPKAGANLVEAVRSGVGLGGFHGGMGDAFRGAVEYEWMVGGHFVGHPHVGPYEVRVTQPGSPVVAGLPASFEYDSEQYYLQIDPAINVLADSTYQWAGQAVTMPVVWTRAWGAGRVFYSALGHVPAEFDRFPFVWEMTVRGMVWAARGAA